MRSGSRSQRLVHLMLVPCLRLLASGCKGDRQATKAAPMQKGEAYMAQEKYAEAIIEFGNAIKADPQDAQVY